MSKPYVAVIKKMQEQISGDIIAHLGQHDLDIIKAEVDKLRAERKKLKLQLKELETELKQARKNPS